MQFRVRYSHVDDGPHVVMLQSSSSSFEKLTMEFWEAFRTTHVYLAAVSAAVPLTCSPTTIAALRENLESGRYRTTRRLPRTEGEDGHQLGASRRLAKQHGGQQPQQQPSPSSCEAPS